MNHNKKARKTRTLYKQTMKTKNHNKKAKKDKKNAHTQKQQQKII